MIQASSDTASVKNIKWQIDLLKNLDVIYEKGKIYRLLFPTHNVSRW